jgi:hypothetical protein
MPAHKDRLSYISVNPCQLLAVFIETIELTILYFIEGIDVCQQAPKAGLIKGG